MSNGKVMIIYLIVGSLKKTFNEIPCIKMIQYFRKPHKSFEGSINVKVDWCNYAPKTDLKNEAGIDTFNFALKSTLAKAEFDETDVKN